MEDFRAFLKSKTIDPERFKKGDPDRYEEFSKLFEVTHPDSLVAQKLFLINALRRKYHYKPANSPTDGQKKKIMMKPKITPNPKR